jgi:hypothetical protein
LIFYADYGVQQASKKFTNGIDSPKITKRSASRKGTYEDNTLGESFCKTLKTE